MQQLMKKNGKFSEKEGINEDLERGTEKDRNAVNIVCM